jgi:hypothetical protein
MKNLVTVTCNKERHMMLLQAESIKKFLKPCNHYIVINEKQVNVDAWREYLAPYYTKHNLHILTQEQVCNDSRLPKNGQLSQQILKIEVSKIIQDDYLIIDTKNFFIKPASLQEWDHYMGSSELNRVTTIDGAIDTISSKYDEVFIESCKMYAKRLGFEQFPPYYFKPMTPFKIDYKLLSKAKLPTDIIDCILYDFDGNLLPAPSEFIFYSLLLTPYIKPGENTLVTPECRKVHISFYHNSQYFIEQLMNGSLEDLIDYSNFKLWGIHRRLLELLSPEHIKKINEYLENKGFDFRYT